MTVSVRIARAVALLLVILAVVLAAALQEPMVRAGAVAIVLAAGWAILSYAARRGAFAPAADWAGRERRKNVELRTLTEELLLYVREIHHVRKRMSSGRRDPADGEERLAAIEREMAELIRKLVQSTTLPS